MIHLEKITEKNVWDICRLNVKESQKEYVAGNDVSLIEAFVAITNNSYAFPFGIYEDELLVGFVMVGYGCDDWEDAPEYAKDNYSIWRLMIDEKYQGKGYGKKAMQCALDFIYTKPCGEGNCIFLSYEPDNIVAKNLYHSFGFIENGEIDGDEVVAILRL